RQAVPHEHGGPLFDAPEGERGGDPMPQVENLVPKHVERQIQWRPGGVFQHDQPPGCEPGRLGQDLALGFVWVVVQHEQEEDDVEGPVCSRDVKGILHLQEREVPAAIAVLHQVSERRSDPDRSRQPAADQTRARSVVQHPIPWLQVPSHPASDFVVPEEHGGKVSQPVTFSPRSGVPCGSTLRRAPLPPCDGVARRAWKSPDEGRSGERRRWRTPRPGRPPEASRPVPPRRPWPAGRFRSPLHAWRQPPTATPRTARRHGWEPSPGPPGSLAIRGATPREARCRSTSRGPFATEGASKGSLGAGPSPPPRSHPPRPPMYGGTRRDCRG